MIQLLRHSKTISLSTKKKIETLYERYLNNDISEDELENFLQMLHTPGGELTVSSLMDGTWQEMFETGQLAVIPMYKRTWYRVVAAASILLTLSAGGYFILNKPAPRQIAETVKQQGIAKNDVAPGGNKAILTLSNGTQIVLDSVANGALAQQGNTKIIKLDNGQLAYDPLNQKPGEVLYNTISTPRGGQYQIVLSDGSRVWLNAASSLRFPASFTGKERKVELTGEGYFEVAKNTAMPFRVSVKGMQVEVLGTHFNVNAYDDEGSLATTLLEGSVKVENEKSENPGFNVITLKSGEQANLSGDGKLKINHYVNTEEVIAWKDGNFDFNNTPVTDIMRQISRWYDMDVEYKGAIPTNRLTGKISRKVNLSQLMDMIQYTGVNMEIKNKKITIWEN